MITELHCHTTASDGLLSPTHLVRLARQRDVTLLAITDHDTIAGHDEALAAGRQNGVRIIPGIEVSALSPQGEVHILGYGVRPTDAATRDKLASLRGVRELRARGILSKLRALGIEIPFERVREQAGDGMIGRPHVARVLVEMGVVASQQQAFDLYLAEGKPAFVAHEGLTPTQAVQLIHASHGVAVMAHPALYRGDFNDLFAALLSARLDGIEVFYPAHTPEQTQQYAALANQHDLLMTGGSDFHGVIGDQEIRLGAVHVPRDCVEALEARIESRG